MPYNRIACICVRCDTVRCDEPRPKADTDRQTFLLEAKNEEEKNARSDACLAACKLTWQPQTESQDLKAVELSGVHLKTRMATAGHAHGQMLSELDSGPNRAFVDQVE